MTHDALNAILTIVLAMLTIALTLLAFSLRLAAKQKETVGLTIAGWFASLVPLLAVCTLGYQAIVMAQLIATGTKTLTRAEQGAVASGSLTAPAIILMVAAFSTFVQWSPWNRTTKPRESEAENDAI